MNTIEVSKPHGFFVWNGKQTAIASDKLLKMDKSLLISDGEAFGYITLEEPAVLKSSVFHTKEWQQKHRIWPDEQKRLWGEEIDIFYVYRIKEFEPFEKPKPFENGKIIDYKPTETELAIIYRAKRLPKTITLDKQAVVLIDGKFQIADTANVDELKIALNATYSQEKFKAVGDGEVALYQLALVRTPNLIVKKKKQVDDMPWEKVRDHPECSAGEIAVAKVNDGELEGCHTTEESANAQLAALNIAEQERSVHGDDDNEDEDKTLHGDNEALEQRLIRIQEQFNRLDNANIIHTFDTHLIVESGGDLFNVNFAEISDQLVFEPREKWTQVDMSFTPRLERRSWTDRLKQVAKTIFSRDDKEVEFMIDFDRPFGAGAAKAIDGKLWHFTWSTNAFEDREGEIFSIKALETFAKESMRKKEGERGTFDLWHLPGTDFAEKRWQYVAGKFLVEAGPYFDNEVGQKAKEFFQKFPDGHPKFAPEGWGASPEFRFLPEDREDKVFDNIWIVRTTTLPRFAAANIWTEGTQIMTKDKEFPKDPRELGVETFGESFVVMLEQQANKETERLDSEGVASKENETETQEENIKEVAVSETAIEIDMDELANVILSKFEVKLEPFTEAIVTLGENVKSAQDRLEKLEKDKEIIEKVEMPRFALNLVKRASEADETVVTEDDKELTEAGNAFNKLQPGESAAGRYFSTK